MEHVQNHILLIDREIVGFIWRQTPPPPHGIAQFFLSFVDLSEVFDLDFDGVIRIAPKTSNELTDRDYRLVIQAGAVQKAALLLEHSNHFERLLSDSDFAANGRIAQEEIAGDLGTDDAYGTSAFNFRRSEKPALRKRDAARQKELVGRANNADVV